MAEHSARLRGLMMNTRGRTDDSPRHLGFKLEHLAVEQVALARGDGHSVDHDLQHTAPRLPVVDRVSHEGGRLEL